MFGYGVLVVPPRLKVELYLVRKDDCDAALRHLSLCGEGQFANIRLIAGGDAIMWNWR